MARFLALILAAAGMAGALSAAPHPQENRLDLLQETPAEPGDSEKSSEDRLTRADLTDYVKKAYPGADPAGEHSLYDLKNPADAAKRYRYAALMSRLIFFYIDRCDQGATIAKIFDQYARTEKANQPTFNALHAVVLLNYPPGKKNFFEAEKLLNTAVRQADDFEYAWLLLAQIEEAKRKSLGTGAARVSELLEKALTLRPDFEEALLFKANLLLSQNPPKTAEALPILDTVFLANPQDPQVFANLLKLYGISTSISELARKVATLIDDGKLSARNRAQARTIVSVAYYDAARFEDSAEWMEAALKDLGPDDDPVARIDGHYHLGRVWASLAMKMEADKSRFTSDEQKLYDTYVEAAKQEQLMAAELERELMPVDLRGKYALLYLQFLARQLLDAKAAWTWLKAYLEETDLASSRRTHLERLLTELEILTADDDEPARIKAIQAAREAEGASGLATLIAVLGREETAVRLGESYESQEAFDLFLGLLGHADREVVGSAAFLLADTALKLGDDAIARAGEAAAARYEQETECVTREQGVFQQKLCIAVKHLDRREWDLRAVKKLKGLVENADEKALEDHLRWSLYEWNSDDWLEKLGDDAPRKLANYRMRNARYVGEFLDEVVSVLEDLSAPRDE